MAFAVPRATSLGRHEHEYERPQQHFSVQDAAVLADVQRQLHMLRVDELANQRRAAEWRPPPQPAWGALTSAPEPWRQYEETKPPPPPPPPRQRQQPAWNRSTHTRSKSFASRVAQADTEDRQRKVAFKLRREAPLLPQEELLSRQRSIDAHLAQPTRSAARKPVRKPVRRQRRWSDPQIKITAPRMHDRHGETLAAEQTRRRAAVRERGEGERFRRWEQDAGEGRGTAGRETGGSWRLIRSREERAAVRADLAGRERALEHGLNGAFGGYEWSCLKDATAVKMLRDNIDREKTRALELEAQLWEERDRERELQRALDWNLSLATRRRENSGLGWGVVDSWAAPALHSQPQADWDWAAGQAQPIAVTE